MLDARAKPAMVLSLTELTHQGGLWKPSLWKQCVSCYLEDPWHGAHDLRSKPLAGQSSQQTRRPYTGREEVSKVEGLQKRPGCLCQGVLKVTTQEKPRE